MLCFLPIFPCLYSILKKKTNMRRRSKSWMTDLKRWVHANYIFRRATAVSEWLFISYMLIVLPKAETRAEFAERTVAKLEKTIDDLEGNFIVFQSFLFSFSLTVTYIVLTFVLNFRNLSLFPLCHLRNLAFSSERGLPSYCPPCLTFELQMNSILRSWDTRLSARSWIMPSMIWTPCKACM